MPYFSRISEGIPREGGEDRALLPLIHWERSGKIANACSTSPAAIEGIPKESGEDIVPHFSRFIEEGRRQAGISLEREEQ